MDFMVHVRLALKVTITLKLHTILHLKAFNGGKNISMKITFKSGLQNRLLWERIMQKKLEFQFRMRNDAWPDIGIRICISGN